MLEAEKIIVIDHVGYTEIVSSARLQFKETNFNKYLE
jgi:hypothetical protein